VSALEETLVVQVKALGLPHPEREVRFHPTRRWRFDLCWPARMVAVEVEGGTWVAGRHSRGKGMRSDAEKYNEAVLGGWRLLRVTSDMVADGTAVAFLERALR